MLSVLHTVSFSAVEMVCVQNLHVFLVPVCLCQSELLGSDGWMLGRQKPQHLIRLSML